MLTLAPKITEQWKIDSANVVEHPRNSSYDKDDTSGNRVQMNLSINTVEIIG